MEFEVITLDRSYVFIAETDEDKFAWVTQVFESMRG